MAEDPPATLRRKLEKLETLNRVGVALSAEKNQDRLVEMILIEAKRLCLADGGTLYLRTEEDRLVFAIMRTDSLGISLGGTDGGPISLPPIPLIDPKTGAPNHSNVATYAALEKRSINVADAYDHEGFDFSGTKAFDRLNNYRSTSLLTIPLVNNEDRVIAVLQLLNARDAASGEVIPFDLEYQRVVEALAAQAAMALDNYFLLDGQRQLLESFIQMIASAIDHKSPYTGGHCERVPILTEMLTRSVCEDTQGAFADFSLTEDEWYELRIAAWLHDCGKITTPVHVMDKATKLETIFDRIELVRTRVELLKRETELRFARAAAGAGLEAPRFESECQRALIALDADLEFLERVNIGGEYLGPEKIERIRSIGARSYTQGGTSRPLLTQEEIANLSVVRGTLTDTERLVINGHMVQTIQMLEALPFPRNLRRVPEYAGGHHEKMDGTGYPRGLFAGDMSIPARIMAIADVFEALTASDRPYKPGKKLSEAMRIMGFMKRDNHLDPELFDHFVSSGVYRQYAARFLAPELIDDVDEQALLSIQPKPYDAPAPSVRNKRKKSFLRVYESASRNERTLQSVAFAGAPRRSSLPPTR